MEYSNQIIIGPEELRHIFGSSMPGSKEEIAKTIAAYLEGTAISQHEINAYVSRLPSDALNPNKKGRRNLHYPTRR